MSTDPNNDYKYTISYLVESLRKAGLIVSHSWVYRQERRGLLSFPRSTTNIKRPALGRVGAVRVMTKNQVNEIVKNFLPGGSGKWFYKNK